MSSSAQETGALYLGCWGCTCRPGLSGVEGTKRTGMSLFQSHRGGDNQGPGQGIPTAVMHLRVLLGTCSFLDAEAPGKSFRKYVLTKSSFTIMFKTELNGKQQRGWKWGTWYYQAASRPVCTCLAPRAGLQGVSRALLLPVSRPAAQGRQTDHGQPEATEEWP